MFARPAAVLSTNSYHVYCIELSTAGPITVQPVLRKVLRVNQQSNTYVYVHNKHMETIIQRDIWNGVSRSIEHNEFYTIDHARTKQRSMVTTLQHRKKR